MNTKKDNTRNNTVNNTNLKPKIQTQTQSKTQTQRLPIDEKKEIQNNLVNMFNLVVIGMIRHITEYYCDTNMSQIQLALESIIIDTPDEPIAYFLLNVYKNDDYRHNILAQNDKFFIDEIENKASDANILSKDHIDNNNQDTIVKMFEFKDLWSQIDDDTKCFIKRSMMALVKICQKYILSL